MQRGVGIQTELLSPEALREMVSGLEIADLVSAVYEPESGYADPNSTVTAYAKAAPHVSAWRSGATWANTIVPLTGSMINRSGWP